MRTRRAGRFARSFRKGSIACGRGGRETAATLLPGGSYGLDLRPSGAVDFQLEHAASTGGKVTIQVIARGAGRHTFEIRTHGLKVGQSRKEVVLAAGEPGILTWEAVMESPDMPWAAVVFADDDVSVRKDVVGPAGRLAPREL